MPVSSPNKQTSIAPQTDTTATEAAPTAPEDLLLVFDPSQDTNINVTHLDFMLLRTAALADGKTQQIPQRFQIEPGVQLISPELWDQIQNNPQPHIKTAIARQAIRVMDPWSVMTLRDRRSTVELCNSASMIPHLQKWAKEADTEDYVKADIEKRLSELSGLTPDQFKAVRDMTNGL